MQRKVFLVVVFDFQVWVVVVDFVPIVVRPDYFEVSLVMEVVHLYYVLVVPLQYYGAWPTMVMKIDLLTLKYY